MSRSWYDLCDRYGIYVIGEANIEAHDMGAHSNHVLLHEPSWKEAIVGATGGWSKQTKTMRA
jgi:beta-galactosidase